MSKLKGLISNGSVGFGYEIFVVEENTSLGL